MSESVYIAAVSARTCVGLSGRATAGAVRAGISRVMAHPLFRDETGEPLYCAWDPQLAPEAMGRERIAALAGRTLDALLAQLPQAKTVAVRLAMPEPRPGWTEQDARHLGLVLSQDTDLVVSAEGHAGALRALQDAFEDVRARRCELAIAGGVDSYLDSEAIAWLDRERRLFRRGARTGFCPGEGAALLALANARTVRQLGLTSLARIRGVGLTREEPDEVVGSIGEGLSRAVAQAARELKEPISDLYGDINGEPHRVEEWGFTALRYGELLRDSSSYVTPVASCGELGAATAALGCILAAHAWQRKYARGRHALVWAGSWGGLRGAALLECPEDGR